MYNAYLYHKLLKRETQYQSEMEKSARSFEAQQKIRDKLLKKYQVRMARRVIDLAVDPVPINTRALTKSPVFMGASIMRLRPRDSKARIHDAVSQNTWLDSHPSLNPISDFRPRHKEKEIQLDMKFTPKDRYERLADKWASDKEIIYSWEVTPEKKSKSSFPNKIKKLYYKSIETVALRASPEACSKDNSLVMLHQISEESLFENVDGEPLEKLGALAQDAMERCKLRPVRNVRYVSARKERFL